MNALRPAARLRRRILPNPQALAAFAALACATLASPAAAQHDRWRSVSVGSDHACALDVDGRAYCWGYNHAGQLGARTSMKCGIEGESGHRGCHPDASETVPLAVGGDVRFASVSAGEYLACGVDAQHAAFCWGAPAAEPARYRDACMDEEPCSFTPVPLMPGRRFVAVDARARCAADADGMSLCWGDPHRAPGRVTKPWQGEEIAFVAGDPGNDGEHPTYCAVRRDGRILCRGDGAFGFRGNGPDTSGMGPVDSPARFSRVAVIEHWACGLDAAGAASCWGASGYDDVRGSAPRPRDEVCERWAVSTYCNHRPAAVEGAPPFRTIVAYPHGTMPEVQEMIGLTADGRAYAWGGDRRPRPWRPEQRWASISANRWGECGVTTAGALFCWGANPHDAVRGRIAHP